MSRRSEKNKAWSNVLNGLIALHKNGRDTEMLRSSDRGLEQARRPDWKTGRYIAPHAARYRTTMIPKSRTFNAGVTNETSRCTMLAMAGCTPHGFDLINIQL
jgi:hypothetical protein